MLGDRGTQENFFVTPHTCMNEASHKRKVTRCMLVTDEVGGTSLECLPSFWIAVLYRKLHQRSATSVSVFGAALERASVALYE